MVRLKRRDTIERKQEAVYEGHEGTTSNICHQALDQTDQTGSTALSDAISVRRGMYIGRLCSSMSERTTDQSGLHKIELNVK